MENLTSFAADVLKGFISGLPLLLFATFVVPKYLDYRKRPKLSMTNRRTDGNIFYFEKTQDGNGRKASFQIGVQNSGLTAQRDWYWNLFVPESLSPKLLPEDEAAPEPRTETMTDHQGEKWVRFMGKVGDAIYPERNYIFPYRVELQSYGAGQPFDRSRYYFFGTEFGLSPRGAKRLGNNVHLNEAAFGGALGEIVVKSNENA